MKILHIGVSIHQICICLKQNGEIIILDVNNSDLWTSYIQLSHIIFDYWHSKQFLLGISGYMYNNHVGFSNVQELGLQSMIQFLPFGIESSYISGIIIYNIIHIHVALKAFSSGVVILCSGRRGRIRKFQIKRITIEFALLADIHPRCIINQVFDWPVSARARVARA